MKPEQLYRLSQLNDADLRRWLAHSTKAVSLGSDIDDAIEAADQALTPNPPSDTSGSAEDQGVTASPAAPAAAVAAAATPEVRAGVYRPEGTFSKVARAFAAAVGIKPTVTTEGFVVTKDVRQPERMRWFATYSNAFEDRDGELVTEAAHKEYVAWVNESKVYPELWLWHAKGTRFGEADWVDFSDGFAHASGLVDAGKEPIVSFLANKELGVSHGFFSAQDGKYINKYRSFEISVLPQHRAAGWATNFNVVGKETQLMAFSAEQRKFLVDAMGEEAVKQLETNTHQVGEQLKQMGIEYKEREEAQAQDANAAAFKAIGEAMTQLTQQVASLAGAVATIQTKQTEQSKPTEEKVDEAVEDAFISRLEKALQAGGVKRPTESDSNVVPDEKTKELTNPNGGDFISEIMSSGIFASVGTNENGASAGVGTTAVATVVPPKPE